MNQIEEQEEQACVGERLFARRRARAERLPPHISVLLNSFWNQHAKFSSQHPSPLLLRGIRATAVSDRLTFWCAQHAHAHAHRETHPDTQRLKWVAMSGRALCLSAHSVGCSDDKLLLCSKWALSNCLFMCVSSSSLSQELLLEDSGGSLMIPPFIRWTPSTPWNPPCLPLHKGTHTNTQWWH